MLKEFIRECLKKAKEEYFNSSHEYYAGQTFRDAEWNNLLKNMDRDFYIEWIDPIIEKEDEDLWYTADSFMLYMVVKKVVEEE